MKPRLAIGLGNPLMGDDGVGWHVAKRLAGDPRLPADGEALCGGTDLLRCAAWIQGRRHVILVDAIQDGDQAGTVAAIEDGPELEERQTNAHQLSAVQAMRLLKLTMPLVRMTLLGVSISSAGAGNGLSAEVESRMPAILERVLEELA